MVAAGPPARRPSAVHATGGRGLRRSASPGAGPASLGEEPGIPLAARREGGSARAQRDGLTSGIENPPRPFGRPQALSVRETPGFAAWGPLIPPASCVRVRGKDGP